MTAADARGALRAVDESRQVEVSFILHAILLSFIQIPFNVLIISFASIFLSYQHSQICGRDLDGWSSNGWEAPPGLDDDDGSSISSSGKFGKSGGTGKPGRSGYSSSSSSSVNDHTHHAGHWQYIHHPLPAAARVASPVAAEAKGQDRIFEHQQLFVFS